MAKDTLTEVYRVAIMVVLRDGSEPMVYRHTAANAAELEEAVMLARRAHADETVQHKVVQVGTLPPVILTPGRGSNALQDLYRTLRLRSFEV